MLKSNQIKYLVIHCSDTNDNKNLDASDIHKMHLNFGWDGIGYGKINIHMLRLWVIIILKAQKKHVQTLM